MTDVDVWGDCKTRFSNYEKIFGNKYKERDIFKGYDKILKKWCVIKVPYNAKHYDKFNHENTMIKKLSHPNIVECYDYIYIDGNSSYTVYELLGDTLKKTTKMNTYTYQQIISIVKQMFDALEYLHNQGIIHGDIKPENVLTKYNDPLNVKFIDFEASFYEDCKERFDIYSVVYQSPERILKWESVTTKTDIWSMGCLLYEIFTGNNLFGNNTFCVSNYNSDYSDTKSDDGSENNSEFMGAHWTQSEGYLTGREIKDVFTYYISFQKMRKHLGEIPPEIIQGVYANDFFENGHMVGGFDVVYEPLDISQNIHERYPDMPEDYVVEINNLVKAMLSYMPSNRPSATDIKKSFVFGGVV